jgi:hypothetical protein
MDFGGKAKGYKAGNFLSLSPDREERPFQILYVAIRVSLKRAVYVIRCYICIYAIYMIDMHSRLEV